MESSKLNEIDILDILLKLYQKQENIKIKYKIVDKKKVATP